MKKITVLSLIVLVSSIALAQNNFINYKALVKDNLGNVVTNQNIDVRFTIFEGATQVYEETHSSTTDANGIVILDIGNGTTTDMFSAIDWSASTSLQTEIDTGSGYVDLGTTDFKSVPYAINAGNTAFSSTANVTSNAPGDIATDDFVFGSTQLAHSAPAGANDNRMFFDKSKGAFRTGTTINNNASFPSDGTAWDDANVGDHSFASGWNTTASGNYSTAMGNGTTASGFTSTAMGNLTTASGYLATAMGLQTIASGHFSTAMGFQTIASGSESTAMGLSTIASGHDSTTMGIATIASGDGSTAMGLSTKAEAFTSTALGRFNIGGGNTDNWIETDPLFEIGNGIDDDNRANALTVLKNGTVTAPTFDLAEITDPKALVTKEYADAQAGAMSTTANITSNAPGDIATDDFVFGSTQLAHSATQFEYDTRMFFDKSKGAFRAGSTFNYVDPFPDDGTAWDDTNVGEHSFASGFNTTASSASSTAIGYETIASGSYSTAMGRETTASSYAATAMGDNTTASGNYSTAMGQYTSASGSTSTALGNGANASGNTATAMGLNTTASGTYSTAMGLGTKANASRSTAIGSYNIGGGTPYWIETDPLFEIGNGTNDDNRANALSVLKNGTILANSLSLDLINSPDVAIPSPERMLVTKEYVDSGAGASGLEQITENDGTIDNTGWRLQGRNAANYGPIGANAVDFSVSVVASDTNGATGPYSFAVGEGSKALGYSSIAMGYYTTASEFFATAMGYSTTASGSYSTAMGRGTKANAHQSTAIGRYNIGGGDLYNWVATDPLFEIGNGTDDANRANALTVLKNGNITINGKTTINEDTASSIAHAITGIKTHTGNYDAYGVLGQNTITDFFGIGVRGNGGYIGVQGNSNGTGSNSYFGVLGGSLGNNTGTNYGVYGNASNGTTNYAVYAAGDLAHTGALINASDRKLKTNISTINNSLENIMRLNPTSYLIRENFQKTMNMSSNSQFGFIAQELQEVFPDLVSRNVHPGANKQDASIEYLGVNYIGLIPVLTKGIQEQQTTIETLEEKVERQEQVIASLVARLEALENR
ncbi:tail fiber domain-containing protein [Winogradskyella sp.]|uniref:tail fiber domain-containing protein n=1 Tax=Winogradskyella sp. TaxID=1883156 RepID=UPI001B040DD9|nr:tail fiber domain-containing protein [Winogradskyella sp.]MBO6880936.1 tail fiber domain-containing protein [Winogradskyella sp.]